MTIQTLSILSMLILFLQYNQGVESLKEHSVPVTKEELLALNRQTNLEVYLHKNRVFVRTHKYDRARGPVPPFKIEDPKNYRVLGFKAETLSLKVDDGWVIAYNMGEFGGQVFWFDKSGTDSHLIDRLSNVLEFLQINGKIYAVSGLAHMGLKDGDISEITRQAGKWVSLEYMKLPDSPLAVTILPDKSILMTTRSQLIRIHPDKNIDVLIEKGFWGVYLHPKSMVVDDDTVYVGMAGGVMKTSLTNPSKQVWMTEN